jgi:hypothetical protein
VSGVLEDRLHFSLALYMRSPELLRQTVDHGYRLLPASPRYGRGCRHHADRFYDGSPATGGQVDAALDCTLRNLLRAPAFEAHRDMLQSTAPTRDRLAGLPLVRKPAELTPFFDASAAALA